MCISEATFPSVETCAPTTGQRDVARNQTVLVLKHISLLLKA
jgi:hypothetical protein